MAPFTGLVSASLLVSLLLLKYFPAYAIRESFLWTIGCILAVEYLLWNIWAVLLYPDYFSPLRRLPEPKDGNFIMGQFFKILGEPAGEPHRRWVEEVPNDGIIRYKQAFNVERILLAGPKALSEVLVTKSYEFVKPPEFITGLGRILGVGVLLAEGDEHKRQRRALMPAFSFRHIKDLYPTFWRKSRELVQRLTEKMHSSTQEDGKSSAAIEVGDWVSRAALDIIGEAGLGRDFGALSSPDNELNHTYRTVFGERPTDLIILLLSLFLPLRLLQNLPLKRNNDAKAASRYIRSFCHDLVQEKKEKIGGGKDILSVALNSGDFSDENLVDQLMTFLAAGHETTASSMIWAVYCLCKHPEAQKRLREEVRANLPSLRDPEAEINANDVDKLPYLHAVCNEVLRLYPPVAITIRKAAKDTHIVGHFVPKRTTVFICPMAINRSKALWGEDACEFNPERWIGPGRANSGGADSNFAMLTFLHGPRSCIGQGFAKAEFACLLAAWAGSFETELNDPNFVADMKGSSGPTVKPKGGLWVKLKALDGW